MWRGDRTSRAMFKPPVFRLGSCFVFCRCGKYGISYLALMEMTQERGVGVNPSMIMRWCIGLHLRWRSRCAGIKAIGPPFGAWTRTA